MPQVSCHVGTMRVASCQHWPTFHAYMSWSAPSAPGQRQKQLALPQDQAVSDTRPRAGGLNCFTILVGGGGPAHNVKRRFYMQMGILSGWARAPPRQQHASRACHCKTFMQRSRFIAKLTMHSSAGQQHGTKLATMGHCHTSGSMKASAWFNSTTPCSNPNLGWNLRMSNCMAHVARPAPRDAH